MDGNRRLRPSEALPSRRHCGAVWEAMRRRRIWRIRARGGVYIGNLGYIRVMHEERDASSCGPLCRDKVFLMDKLGCLPGMLAPLDV